MYVTNGHLIAFSSQLYTLTAIYFPTATIYFNAYRPSFTIVGLGLGAPDGCRGHRGDRIPGLVRAAATASSSCSVPAHCRITPSASVISSVVESVRPSTADAARILSDTAFKHTFNGS